MHHVLYAAYELALSCIRRSLNFAFDVVPLAEERIPVVEHFLVLD